MTTAAEPSPTSTSNACAAPCATSATGEDTPTSQRVIGERLKANTTGTPSSEWPMRMPSGNAAAPACRSRLALWPR